VLIPSLELVSYLIGCWMSADANISLCSVESSKNSEAASRAPFMTDFCRCHGLPPVSVSKMVSASTSSHLNFLLHVAFCSLISTDFLLTVIVSKLVRLHQLSKCSWSSVPLPATSVWEGRATNNKLALTWKHPCSRHASAISWMTSALIASPMLSRSMLITGNVCDDSHDPLGSCRWLAMYIGEKQAGPHPETPN